MILPVVFQHFLVILGVLDVYDHCLVYHQPAILAFPDLSLDDRHSLELFQVLSEDINSYQLPCSFIKLLPDT